MAGFKTFLQITEILLFKEREVLVFLAVSWMVKGRAEGHSKPFTNTSQRFIISALSTEAQRSPKVHELWLTRFLCLALRSAFSLCSAILTKKHQDKLGGEEPWISILCGAHGGLWINNGSFLFAIFSFKWLAFLITKNCLLKGETEESEMGCIS